MAEPRHATANTQERQLSEYRSLREAVDKHPSLNYDILRNMAHYIATYGNRLPVLLQKNGNVEAFTTEQVEKAYYVSDAFAKRAARSLGYLPEQKMRPEDKAIYDRIIERGKKADIIDVTYDRDLRDIDSFFWDIDEDIVDADTGEVTDRLEEHEATIGTKDAEERKGKKDPLGMDTLGHEMGHFLYTGHNDEKSLNPGISGRKNYNGAEEQQYGKPGSPLRTIDASPSREATLRQNLKLLAKDCTEDEQKELQKDNYRAALKSSREHDDTGMERGADVHGVRTLMMKEGIWNFLSGKRVTLHQVLQFKKEHPTSRVFQYWTPQQVVYYLNNIAMSEPIANVNAYTEMASTNFERIADNNSNCVALKLHKG